MQGRAPSDRGQVGDRFDDARGDVPGGVGGAVFPYVMALDLGWEFSWEEVPMKIKIHCADPKGIVLEVERVENP